MTMIRAIHDEQAQLITGGCICEVVGFTKENGTDKCRGNATAAAAGKLEKNGKEACCPV